MIYISVKCLKCVVKIYLKIVKLPIESNNIFVIISIVLNYFTKNIKYNQKSPNNFQA